MADTAEVTIVVVPRERFSRSIDSLESVYRNTAEPFKLIYIDGNSPRHVRRYLESQAAARGFRLLRTDRYLVPNHARNLGVAQADTEYTVFLDNDVLVSPGWVFHLLNCAKETGAWLVIPLYLEGRPEDGVVHMAGGVARLEGEDGRRIFKNVHRFFGKAVAEVRDQLRREPTGSIEYHCLLARRDVFDKIGPFDEQIPSLWEHTDLALAVQEAGGGIYFEPSAVVSYDSSGRLKWYDFPYFAKRWSDEWGRVSIDHFRRKWGLSEDDPNVKYMYHYSSAYRRNFLRRWFPVHPRLFGHNLTTPAVKFMDRMLQFCFAREEWRMPVEIRAPASI